jgi:hypothetical protein
MSNMNFFYDQQIRRYMLQAVRAFSHFYVEESSGGSNPRRVRVPCRWGDPSRMVAAIISGNSDNVIPSLPFISVAIQTIQPDGTRRMDPSFTRTDQFAERAYDAEAQEYLSSQGNLYSVTRYMPVPYLLTLQVDIFTNNIDSKLQILEQIFTLYNPSLQLATNSNPIDWTNITEIKMADIVWSSRSIPRGTEDPIDASTITFNVDVWITPPALIKRQTLINTIMTDIHLVNSVQNLGYSDEFYNFFQNIEASDRIIVTPNNYHLEVEGSFGAYHLRLRQPGVGSPISWAPLIEMYGSLREGSTVTLNLTDNIESNAISVSGFVAKHPSQPDLLFFDLDADTLPTNTLPPVDAIINPVENIPGENGFPLETEGQRYLLVERIIASKSPAWNVDANEGDIIQYTDGEWSVVFNSGSAIDPEWVLNSFTDQQWTWTGTQWIHSFKGTYNPGFWRLSL